MQEESPIINIFTYRLPFELANQIYNEYQTRLGEVKYILTVSPYYQELRDELDVIEILLALSIFHKRVIANLDAAVKFHKTVEHYGKADTIKIGEYDFTGKEKNQLLNLILNYKSLMDKYGIPSNFMDYYESKEFLKKVLMLKEFDDLQENETDGDNNNDIPF